MLGLTAASSLVLRPLRDARASRRRRRLRSVAPPAAFFEFFLPKKKQHKASEAAKLPRNEKRADVGWRVKFDRAVAIYSTEETVQECAVLESYGDGDECVDAVETALDALVPHADPDEAGKQTLSERSPPHPLSLSLALRFSEGA